MLIALILGAPVGAGLPPVGPPAFAVESWSGDATALAVADVNVDGWPDWLGVSDLADSEAVLAVGLNTGRGRCILHTVPLGAGAGGVACGDLDADGKPDVVTTHSVTARLEVRGGDGLGGFGDAALVPTGGDPHEPALADLDVDGDLDVLLLALDDGGVVQVAANDGLGGLAAPASYLAAFGAAERAVVADVGSDGVPDVAVLGQLGGLHLLAGDGGGGLLPSTWLGSFAAARLDAGDADGDGLADLVVLDRIAGRVNLFLGQVGAVPQPAGFASVPPLSADIACGDVSGDGLADAVVIHDSGLLSVCRGQPAGALASPSLQPLGTSAQSSPPRELILLDADLDGLQDILWSRPRVVNFDLTLPVSLAFASGDGEFDAPAPYGASIAAPALDDVALADLEGDGAADLLGLDTKHNLIERRSGDGAGSFGPVSTVATGPGARCMQAADADADGDVDMVLGKYGAVTGPNLGILTNDGTGQLAPFVAISTGQEVVDVAVGDLNGDGLPDVVGAIPFTDVVLFTIGLGGGAFGPPDLLPGAEQNRHVLVHDFDGDGSLDFAASGDDGVHFWSLAPLVSANFHGGPARAMDAGDLDGDGVADLVLARLGGIEVLHGLGDAQFEAGTLLVPSPEPAADVRVLDLDLDGRLDALASLPGAGALAVLRGDGQLGFRDVALHAVENVPRAVTVAAASDGGPLLVAVAAHVELVVMPAHVADDPWASAGGGLPGTAGVPRLEGNGPLQPATSVSLTLDSARPFAPVVLVVGTGAAFVPVAGGTLVPQPQLVWPGFVSDSAGHIQVEAAWPPGVPGGTLLLAQAWIVDPLAPQGWAASGGALGIAP